MNGINITLNIPCQCRGCTDRFVGCHDKCEKYADYRAKLDEYQKANMERERKRECAFSAALLRAVMNQIK